MSLTDPVGNVTSWLYNPLTVPFETVYNLTVAGLHTYYVLAGDQPVLVHNCQTPNTAARQSVQGSYVDPLTNQTVHTSDTLAADHVFPRVQIESLPGFAQLNPTQQRQVLNYLPNFQGLPGFMNSSKGGRLADNWNTIRNQPLNQTYQQNLQATQNQMRQELQELIDSFLGG